MANQFKGILIGPHLSLRELSAALFSMAANVSGHRDSKFTGQSAPRFARSKKLAYNAVGSVGCCMRSTATVFCVFLFSPHCHALASTDPPWQAYSRQACIDFAEGRFQESKNGYRQALKKMSEQGCSTALRTEVKLSYAGVFIEEREFSNAATILKEVQPFIAEQRPRSLMAMRFWHLSRNVEEGRRNYGAASAAQRHVLDILGSELSSSSFWVLEQQYRMMMLLLKERKWQEAARIARIFLKQKEVSSGQRRDTFNNWIKFFMSHLVSELDRQTNMQVLADYGEVLKIYCSFPHDPQQIFLYWGSMRKILPPARYTEITDAIIKGFEGAQQLNGADKRVLALALYEKGWVLRTETQKYANLEENLASIEKASSLLDTVVPVSERSKDLLYIQVKCVHAMLLSAAHRLAEAEQIIDRIGVSSRANLINTLSPVTQARVALALAYAKESKLVDCQRQRRKLEELSNSLPRSLEKTNLMGVGLSQMNACILEAKKRR